jgi:DNA/RNA-binding domain of Phe-tRNA-synthetase-like protein
VRALGIDACMAVFEGVKISNRSNPLERRKREALEVIRAVDLASHPFLAGYRALHREVGVVEDVVPPAQHLVRLVQGGGRLPNINTAVDSYNLVSALTGLSAGAHDLAHVRGDLRLGLVRGDERYTPLGEAGQVPVRPGEYACMDLEKILCRLDVKQCQQTRITRDTTSFLVYLQGCRAVPREALVEGLRQISDLVTEVCGGTCRLAESTT